MTGLADIDRPEPRWPVVIAAFSAVALHYALPDQLRLGPHWGLAVIVALLSFAAHITRYRGKHGLNNLFGYSVLLVLTGGLAFGVIALLFALLHGTEKAPSLLRSAAVLWATNVIVFASWYWRLDAGGPNARERRDVHMEGAFLFPQMTFPAPNGEDMTIAEHERWRPHFVDYLFVAFNTSTAFSPTDAPVLSKWAKIAMMMQAIISFTTVVLIAARAVNIL
ncbi:MAG: hypothetical protein M3Z05_14345 [Gemmatimonadota bacterium]|nr:hypothetical protein [Gemmatimonadota bacterium]